MKKTYYPPKSERVTLHSEHQMLAGSRVGVRIGKPTAENTWSYPDEAGKDLQFIDQWEDRKNWGGENTWW